MTELNPTPAATKDHSLRAVVQDLSRWIGRLDKGAQADLRRGNPSDPTRPTLWRLLFGVVEPAGRLPAAEGAARDAAERAWAILCWAIATAGADHFSSGRAFGRALRAAGVSELRFVRLLRANVDQIEHEVRGVIGQLASKGESSDPHGLALLLGLGHGDAETIRRDIARDYFDEDRKQGKVG